MIKYAILYMLALAVIPAYAQAPITMQVNADTLTPGRIVEITGSVDAALANKPVAIEIRDSEGNVILIRSVTPDSDGKFSLKFKVPDTVKAGEIDVTTNVEMDGQTISESKSVVATATPKPEESAKEPTKPKCGAGTIEKDGMCVPDIKEEQVKSGTSREGGGCLIATAAYGTESASQVQLLREIRNNVLLRTDSGTAFMTGFNEFYYSFSPLVADWERQSPWFKEAVRIATIPMLSTLSILNYVNIDSEQEMLGYGIGIMLLNVGAYFVVPAIIIIKLGNRLVSKKIHTEKDN